MKQWCPRCRMDRLPSHVCDEDWTVLDDFNEYVLIFNGRANFVGTDHWIKNTLEPLRARDKRVHCVFIHYENDSVDEHVTSVNGFGDMTVTSDQLRTQNPRFRLGEWNNFVGKHFDFAHTTQTFLVKPQSTQSWENVRVRDFVPGWKNQYHSLVQAYKQNPKFFHWNKNTCILRMRWDSYVRFDSNEQCQNFWEYLSYDLRYWERLVSLKNYGKHYEPERRAVIGLRPDKMLNYYNKGTVMSHDFAQAFDGPGLRYLMENYESWATEQYHIPETHINQFFLDNQYDVVANISGGLLRDLSDPDNRSYDLRATADDYRLRWYTYFT